MDGHTRQPAIDGLANAVRTAILAEAGKEYALFPAEIIGVLSREIAYWAKEQAEIDYMPPIPPSGQEVSLSGRRGGGGVGSPPIKGGSPPPPTPPPNTQDTDKTDKKEIRTAWGSWTDKRFREEAEKANSTGEPILTPSELSDFCDYWLSPSKSGIPAFRLEKTWSMRGRLRTAFTMVYSRQREAAGLRNMATTAGSSQSDGIDRGLI